MQQNNLEKEISETLTPAAPEQSTIRTMKGDVTMAIQKQQETLVSIAMAEEKKKAARQAELVAAAEERAQKQEAAPKRRGRIFVILILLVVIAGGVLGYIFVLPKLGTINLPNISLPVKEEPIIPPAPIEAAPKPIILTPALIPTQAETIFSIKKESAAQIFSTIKNERLGGDTSWEVKNFIITDDVTVTDGSQKIITISANRLVTLAGLTMPEILARSFQSTFMAGLMREENSTIPTPFLILKISGYTTALAGMLQWEQKLPTLFDTVFGTNITAGLTEKTKTRDVLILGRDARVLEITPNVGIAYMFANQSTLIIAGSRTALEKIGPMLTK